MPKQFNIPDSVIGDVVAGRSTPEAYSPYLSAIHKKHVIGINVAYRIGTWIDIVFFGDNGFYLTNRERLLQFPNIKIGCGIGVQSLVNDGIKAVSRDARKFGISDNPACVCWNNNSGCAAISVAANAGVKRIILLGFDMALQNNAQHWHTLYKDRAIKKPVPHPPFERHLKGFPDIARDAKRRGVTILNASPDSVVQEFEKVSVKDLL